MWDTLAHRWLRLPYTLYVHKDVRGAKKPRTTVLFIHGIGNTGASWGEVIKVLPPDLRLVSIDLLGFGQSKSPAWAVYNAKTQARSVLATYLKLRLSGQVVIVGHSLGALVAVEIAKRYPLLVKSIILCSPPFYREDPVKRRLFPDSDRMLKRLYTRMITHPEELLAISKIFKRLGLVNKSFNLTRDNSASYINALETSIINQTAFDDAVRLKVPTFIFHGRLDPIVIYRNLKAVAERNINVKLLTVLAAHEVEGLYVNAVAKAINAAASLPQHTSQHDTPVL